MKKFFVILAAAAVAVNVSAQKTITLSLEQSGATEIIENFWNNSNAPHSNFETRDEKINDRLHFSQTSQTDFYIYKADPAKATGQGIVVLPGGGYSKVCIAHEGFEIAKFYRDLGITAVVVKYRLPNLGHKEVPLEDAQAVGLTDVVKVIGNGSSIAGNALGYISQEAEDRIRNADVVISKGQGNFESLNGCGLNIYYLFLCKCDWFVRRFKMKRLTGILVNDRNLENRV